MSARLVARHIPSALLAALLLAVSACAGGGASRSAAPGGAPPAAAGAAPSGDAPAVAPPATIAAPALRSVRLAYVSTATIFAGLWAAREYGLLEQHVLRADDLLYINGGPALAQALVAGELDAGYGAFSPAATAIASGAPLKIVGGIGYGFVHHLFTRDGSGIQQAADLKGKRVGVSRIGSESQTVVRFWARSHGVEDDDITYVNAGGAGERLAALAAGSVDLLPLDPPMVVKAQKLGYREIADLTSEPLPWLQDGLILQERTLHDDPALARAITAAVIEGSYLVRSDRRRAFEVLGKYIGEKDPDALDYAYQGYVRKFVDHARPDPVAVESVLEFVDESLPGAAHEPYNRFVDLSVLDQLESDGFFARLERQYPAP